MTWLLAAAIALALHPPTPAAVRVPAPVQPLGRTVCTPFDYQGVTLDDGPLRRQFDDTREYYLRIPNDDLLKGFRKRAGLPAPGADLGGWYSADVFHIFGQILSGLARMYAATGDPACRAKAEALLDGWAACIAPDGYFYYSTRPNAPHYIYDKIVGGLVDMYLYCGSRKALGCLKRTTRWAEKHLDRSNRYAFNAGEGPTEWYTLSENLYRAYLATGDPEYREFGRVWEYTDYWNRYANRDDIFAPKRTGGPSVGGYHAYSHVNTLGGAGAAYLLTGQQHYLGTLTGAYDYLQANECYATGGYGPGEQILPSERVERALETEHNTFETQCGCWAAFKMGKYLVRFTGDARYGDWIERLVVNGIGATIPMTADGRVFYYSDYCTAGATKRNTGTGWTCCAGTRPEAVADYHDLIYFHDAAGLYVNLFTPSTIRWKQDGTLVAVGQRTPFPEGETNYLTVSTPHPARFAIRLRAPAWLAAPMGLAVNGTAVPATPDARHWVTVQRTWHDGDRLAVRLPMGFWTSRIGVGSSHPAAVLRGPVVLAFRTTDAATARRVDLDHLATALTPIAGEPLTYRLATDPDVLVRPFYAFREGERYLLYLDPAASATRWQGQWNDGGSLRYTNVLGAAVEHEFEGTGVRWLGGRFDDGGRGQVYVDGKPVAVVDQYGPGRGLPFDWKIDGLPRGKHVLRIVVLPDKDPASKDRYINVAGFETIP